MIRRPSYLKMEKQYEGPLKYYVTLCKKGILLPGRNLKRSPSPKISVIIPMFNEEKNALTIIRSVQNQTMQDIEIVCVNDCSTDKTLSILESLQIIDQRITIITNPTNRGVMYNRIYGALHSKGEYVTFIDADDAICNFEIFQKAYDNATKDYGEKLDIVHYQTCGCKYLENGDMDDFYLFFTFNLFGFNKVLKQPEIKDNYRQKKNHISGSGFVFDKIYSRELIQRVADYIGPHIWNQHLIFVDDFLLAVAAMRMTNSMVNSGQIGYWHFMDTETSTTSNVFEIVGDRLKYPDKTNKKLGDYMIILERILELTDDDKETIETRENILKNLVQDQYLPSIARSVHFDKFISLFEKLYNWEYTGDDLRKRIGIYIEFCLKYWIDPEKKVKYILDEKL
jgi:glycosyltransferase involved in cell wall biosynthesis